MPQDRRKVSWVCILSCVHRELFQDVIMANGIPCETISDPVMKPKL